MGVISRVLYGSLHIKSYDLVSSTNAGETAASTSGKKLQMARQCSDEVITAPRTTELLPDRGNLHEFVGGDEIGCAIFDILTPPYDVAEGRDCTYYRVAGTSVAATTGEQKEKLVALESFDPVDFDVSTEPKATSGRDVPELLPAPPAKKRKRRVAMPRIWLRLELFELGLVPLPSKYAATLTVGNVKKALDALHTRFQAAAGGDDAMMGDADGAFVESDSLNAISFASWKDAVDGIFQWREQDYKAFWLLLVQFHRQIPVKDSAVAAPLDVEQCLTREEVPVFKMAVFLFIQTVKPHSWRTKYSLDSFNAVWYREHAESLAAAAALDTSATASVGAKSPLLGAIASGSGSPRLKGSASPPPPASPHTVGMADRSTADAYYLAFVREKLEDLFALLYPSVELKDESQTVVSADQIDLLGFLLCVGDNTLTNNSAKLSSCYPKWELPMGGDEMEGTQTFTPRVENGAKICRFYKTHLSLNEKLYPPVGFTVGGATTAQSSHSIPSPTFSLNEETPSPIVLSQLVKTTVIKRAEEIANASGYRSDLIIFSCHDTYIYILGPSNDVFLNLHLFFLSTNVMISACKNCRILTAPNVGILSMERCENVQLTALSGLIRVSNCLDSRLNIYTLFPVIMSGENVGVVLGPYNSKYAGLAQQLAATPFLYNPESMGCWNSFLDLDSDKAADSMADAEKQAISLQAPETFREVCVPVKPSAGAGSAERPFPIPAEYASAVKSQYETVESLRQLVTSDEFDLSTKRTMEVVIQLRFKEWLSTTSNVRQILDLVHIERANPNSDVYIAALSRAVGSLAGCLWSFPHLPLCSHLLKRHFNPSFDSLKMAAVAVDSATLGFPRMGPNRELKFALEKFWRSKISEQELFQVAHAVEEANWRKQLDAGVGRVGVGMFSLYDHVLDWTFYLGLAPERFAKVPVGLAQYFAMARGVDGIPALDMTKWFDSNYHYEVPELNAKSTPKANFGSYLSGIKRALSVVGPNKSVPVILGPLTYLTLSKYDGATLDDLLVKVLPLYTQLLEELSALGVREVQIHEPSLVGAAADKLAAYLPTVYGTKEAAGAIQHASIAINLATYFEEINHAVYQWFAQSPVAAISLDFTRGDNLSVLQKFGFPAGKRLGAGLIDGRSVWKFNPTTVLSQVAEIKKVLAASENAELTVQTSSSLQHVPYTTECEKALNAGETDGLLGVLSFAYEKLAELEVVKKITQIGEEAAKSEIDEAKKAWAVYYEKNPAKAAVQARLAAVTEADFKRPSPFPERRPTQLKGLPVLPTTTIGSFPQTPQIRALRRKLKAGDITLEHYRAKIDEQIAYNIGIQEALGLDILVHGEPERTDMVEYFAEKLEGFAFTQNGWVQSYGSRCVRPPIIFADLVRPADMTVREFVVAQSFTSKPVKGMLTGPVTILNWSFPRKDISRKDQAFQL
ncbi:hypothetical protein BBJ28_00010755, partial [Nothophytophthora sp. Chile5]